MDYSAQCEDDRNIDEEKLSMNALEIADRHILSLDCSEPMMCNFAHQKDAEVWFVPGISTRQPLQV